ncbi:MAG: ABC transporter substrate-binding protein [Acidimicrobiales bacterium]
MQARGRAGRGWVAGLVAVAILAGCSGDEDADREVTTTTGRPDEVVEGGAVRLGLAGPVVVDPAAANPGSPSDLLVLDLLHDGLVRAGGDGELEPAVAATWQPDAAGMAWTFVLDPDATFASGRPIAADDVIASLERVIQEGDASLAALRFEAVTGFREFVDGTAAHLAGLTKPAEGTVGIALDTPVSVLPDILAGPELGIVDITSLDAALGADDQLAALDLSGSWKVEDADGDSLTVARRTGAEGHLDGVVLRSYDDADDAYDAFEDGDVDWVLVPPDRFADAVDDHGDDHVAPFHAELFFGMRTAGPSLAQPELRQAIAAAIDREAIVEAVYADLADPLLAVVPDGVPGHAADPCADCGHDPDRAEALITAAYPDGAVPTIGIDFDESPAQQTMAELVAADLEAVGIPSALRPKPLEEYKAFVATGGQELFSFGWIGGYLSPDAYLSPLFRSDSDDNLTGYGDVTVDTALTEARGLTDEAGRAERWGNVEAQVLADAAVVPIAQFRIQPAVAGRVQDLRHAVDGSVDWSAVWVADGA